MNPSSDGEYCERCDQYFSEQAEQNAKSLEQMAHAALENQKEQLHQDGILEMVKKLTAGLRNYQTSRPTQTLETRRVGTVHRHYQTRSYEAMNRVGPGEMDIYSPVSLLSYNNFITLVGLLEVILNPISLKVDARFLITSIIAMKCWLALHFPGQMNAQIHDRKLIYMIISYYFHLISFSGTDIFSLPATTTLYLQYMAKDLSDLLFPENPIDENNTPEENTEGAIAFNDQSTQALHSFITELGQHAIDMEQNSDMDTLLQDIQHAFIHNNRSIVLISFYRRDEDNNRQKMIMGFMFRQPDSLADDPKLILIMGLHLMTFTIRYSQLRQFISVYLLAYLQNLVDIAAEKKAEVSAQQQTPVAEGPATANIVLTGCEVALAVTTLSGVCGIALDFLWSRSINQTIAGRILVAGSAWLLLYWYKRNRKF